ncbi:DDE-1 domain-containing protein [Entamoeba marina]
MTSSPRTDHFNVEGVLVGLREMFSRVINSEEFMKLPTLSSQVFLLKRYCPVATNEEIAIVLSIKKEEVEHYLSNNEQHSTELYLQPKRHSLSNNQTTETTNTLVLSQCDFETETAIVKGNEDSFKLVNEMIDKFFEQNIAVTENTIQCFVDDYCEDVSLTIKKFRLKEIKCKVDKRLLEPNIQQLIDFYNMLKKKLDGTPIAFIFNCDEYGFQENIAEGYLEVLCRKKQKVVTVDRNCKCSQLFFCICADGTYLMPFCVLDDEETKMEMINKAPRGIPLMCSGEETVSITRIVFSLWFEAFCNEVKRKREQYSYSEVSYLLLDPFYKNYTKSVKEQALNNKIEFIFFPEKMDFLVQPLNSIYQEMLRIRNHSTVQIKTKCSPDVKNILRILKMWRKVAPEGNIITSFEGMGIFSKKDEEDITDNCNYCYVKKMYHSDVEGSGMTPDEELVNSILPNNFKKRKTNSVPMDIDDGSNSETSHNHTTFSDILNISAIPKPDDDYAKPKKREWVDD